MVDEVGYENNNNGVMVRYDGGIPSPRPEDPDLVCLM